MEESGGTGMSNAKIVQGIYDAFNRQDAEGILEPLADDVAWEHWENNYAVKSGEVPYLVERNGKQGVMEWLGSLQGIEMRGMEIHNILEGDNEVAVSFSISFTVKATGKVLSDEEMHLWTFGPDGKIVRLRHYVDTAKHLDVNRA